MANVIVNQCDRLPEAAAAETIGRAREIARGLQVGSASRSCVPSCERKEAFIGRDHHHRQPRDRRSHEVLRDCRIGHNHQGSVEKAREMFREAKLAGANAVKLQKRDNRGLFTRAAFDKPYDNENSFGSTYGEHREFLEFGAKEYRELQAYARELDVDFFSTAFDPASADLLRELHVPAATSAHTRATRGAWKRVVR
jgi:hypothetical protein